MSNALKLPPSRQVFRTLSVSLQDQAIEKPCQMHSNCLQVVRFFRTLSVSLQDQAIEKPYQIHSNYLQVVRISEINFFLSQT